MASGGSSASGKSLKDAASCCYYCFLRACKVDDFYLRWIVHAPFRVEHYVQIEYKEMAQFFQDTPPTRLNIIKNSARWMIKEFGRKNSRLFHVGHQVFRTIPTNIPKLDEELGGFKTGQVYAFLKDAKSASICDSTLKTIINATVDGQPYPIVSVISTTDSLNYVNGDEFGVIYHKITPVPQQQAFDKLIVTHIVELLAEGPEVHTIVVDHILPIHDETSQGKMKEPSIALWLDILSIAGSLANKTVLFVLDGSTFSGNAAEEKLKSACRFIEPSCNLTTIQFDDEDPAKWTIKKYEHTT